MHRHLVPMRPRRGFAMIAALWLVVAIATVALYFATDARERRQLGIEAAERGRAHAAALGALAMTQARLDAALQQVGASNAQTANLRSSDPWLGIDSIFSGRMYVDSVLVDIRFVDPGQRLNVNTANETSLRTFFAFLLRDTEVANDLAASLMDWRDADSLPRVNGAERDDYIKKQRLVLPTNAPFREIEELIHLNAMTPEIYATVVPYLSTRGNGQINVNTAPEPVLRALPGVTDDVIATILGLRSQGRRIESLNDVFAGMSRNSGRGQSSGQTAQQRGLQQSITLTTNTVEIYLTAWAGKQALPSRLVAQLSRNNTRSTLESRRW